MNIMHKALPRRTFLRGLGAAVALPFLDSMVPFSAVGRAAAATFLTGVHPYKTGGADFKLGISADQIAAKELGKYTQLSSLELGLESQPVAGTCDSGYTCAYMSMSWRSDTQP